mmetsp:Transcript_21107/g.30911  ORF Transcript_21107/g.30911 Transcript_21107/m.30911 type:complete len:107 (+) Transcript_21107:63-383(+)
MIEDGSTNVARSYTLADDGVRVDAKLDHVPSTSYDNIDFSFPATDDDATLANHAATHNDHQDFLESSDVDIKQFSVPPSEAEEIEDDFIVDFGLFAVDGEEPVGIT